MEMDMMMAVAIPTSSLSNYYAKNKNRTLKTQQSLVSYSLCNHPIVIPSSAFKIRNNRSSDNKLTTFCRLQAQGKYRSASPDLMEMTDFDDFDGDENYDDDDEEEEEELMPLGKMKKWLENKPPGFGEGKVYETRIEDKLVEEIEQSRLAQAANINNLKNSSAAAAIAPIKTAPHQTNKGESCVGEVFPNTLTMKKQYKIGASKKKIICKGRGEKASVLGIPGSAKRSKIKEKAVLTDVFNKYG